MFSLSDINLTEDLERFLLVTVNPLFQDQDPIRQFTMVKGKVFTVTGGASGIGRATAIRLAELGAKAIAISDVNDVGLQETADQCMLIFPVIYLEHFL